MHLFESYCLSAGVPQERPILNDQYFPIPFEKYIVLHTTTKNTKTYDYFNCVVWMLKPVLEKHGIEIVEIGSNGQIAQRGTHSIIGKTSMSQAFGVIRNAMLILGVDSVSLHAAGIYDVPLVGVYSNANYIEAVKPYFGSKEKQILMHCETGDSKPTFSFEEFPKSINTIKPEVIVQSVCKLLGLEFNFPFKTLQIGNAFARSFVEGIPNQVVDLSTLNLDSLVLRMDEYFDENILVEQAKRSKVAIVTNKPIKLDVLKLIKPQIQEIVYEITNDNSPSWVNEIVKLGIKIGLYTFLENSELNKFKEAYLDLPLINQRKAVIPDCLKDKDMDKIFIISNRFVLSSNKVFPSLAHWRNDQTIPCFDFCLVPIAKTPDFFKEDGCFWYLEKLD